MVELVGVVLLVAVLAVVAAANLAPYTLVRTALGLLGLAIMAFLLAPRFAPESGGAIWEPGHGGELVASVTGIGLVILAATALLGAVLGSVAARRRHR